MSMKRLGKTDRLDFSSRWSQFLVFVVPFLIIYSVFFMLPLIQGLYYSFTNWKSTSQNAIFTGLKNYHDLLFRDPYFFNSLAVTFKFTVLNVLFSNLLAVLLALFFTTQKKERRLIKSVLFMPNMISMVVAGFIWVFIFGQIFPFLFQKTEWLIFRISWLGDENRVIGALVMVSIWHGVGYLMTIYIAGFQGIDPTLVEAALIDGANSLQMLIKIKLRLMLPVFSVGLFINIAGSLKIFDIVMSLTAGGPGRSSEVVMLNIYREAFVNNNMGYGSAKATVLSIIIILVVLLQFRLTREEFY